MTTATANIIVVGSGLAGLFAAIKITIVDYTKPAQHGEVR